MTDDDDFAPPPPAQRTWLQRLRGLALAFLILVGILALLLFGGRWQMGRVGEQHLRAERARLDAEDPNWTLAPILAARDKAKPADADNAAPLVLKIAADIPDEWKKWQHSEEAGKWAGGRPSNHLPPAEANAAARTFAADTHLVRTEALKLRDARGGLFAIEMKSNPLLTLLPHLNECRTVAALLQYDARLALLDGNPNRAVSAARAILGVARAVGDEPFAVSQLVRLACAAVAAQTTAQVLAWGTPIDGLAELQAELLAAAEVPYFAVGVRGERAAVDQVFRGLADGSISFEELSTAQGMKADPKEHAILRLYRPLIPGNHAKALEILSQYVEAAKLPHHELLAAVKQVPVPQGTPEEFRHALTRLLLPAAVPLAEAGLRVRADLLAAAAGVACERFRQTHGRLPRDPNELVPAYLSAIPTNPFDATPVEYRTFGDRVAVYFYWADASRKVDDLPDEFRAGRPPGAAFGLRLWPPERRGLPPEDPKVPFP